MRFGPGSELEQWMADRHLFGLGVLFCIFLAIAVVALAHIYTMPDPICGWTPAPNGECRLNVEHD